MNWLGIVLFKQDLLLSPQVHLLMDSWHEIANTNS
jgi:hypothetical protein